MFTILEKVFNKNLFANKDDIITENSLKFYFSGEQADADLDLIGKEDKIAKIEVKSKDVISDCEEILK